MRPVVHYLNSPARETDALSASEALGGLYTARQVLLTRGETRVLRYLPTHLSAREIAMELYLSPNTVKTHQRHLYEKLGAHSRAQAVERARALGLLTRPSRGSVRETVYGLAR
jgi:ATP/maltotriose-dependent transcriptional regulator MalT